MGFRFDTSRVGTARKNAAGFLIAQASLTRTGVFPYRRADGSIRMELRHPDDVFNADSLRSFAMLPVTNDHPPERALSPSNVARRQVGALGENVRKADDGVHVDSTICVMDALAIADVEAGKVELSNGYTCDLDESPGVWNGQRYDARQTNIRGNHVAIVDHGRAGPSAKIKLDSADAICDSATEPGIPALPRKTNMRKIVIDGIEVEVTAEQAAMIEKARADASKDVKARADAALAASEKARADAEKLAADNKARMDALLADMPRLVAERNDLEVNAVGILGEGTKLDGVADLVLKRAIVAKRNPSLKCDALPAEAIEVLYTAVRADVDNVGGLETAEDGDDPTDPGKRKDAPKAAGTKAKNFDGKSITATGKNDRGMRTDQTMEYGEGRPAGAVPANVRTDSEGRITDDACEHYAESQLRNDGTCEIGTAEVARAIFIKRRRDQSRQPLAGARKGYVPASVD